MLGANRGRWHMADRNGAEIVQQNSLVSWALRLFYVVAIPVFFYILVLAMTSCAVYEFAPVLTVGITLITWYAIYRNREKIRKLIKAWCSNENAIIITALFWGVLLVSFSIALRVDYTWDYGKVMLTAYQWAKEGTMDAEATEYFSRYPNNALLLVVLYLICKIMLLFLPNASLWLFRVVGCLVSSFSIFISGAIFLKAASLFQKEIGKIFLLLYMTCVPLWIYSTICYTDTLGLPILAGSCWCFSLAIKKGLQKQSTKWMALHGVFMAVAFTMKATLAIVFIANFVFLIFCSMVHRVKKDAVKSIIAAAVTFLATTMLLAHLVPCTIGITPRLREKYEFPKLHWVMMSMSTTSESYNAGGYQQDDVDYTKGFKNREKRETAVKERLLARLKNPERPLAEHILFQKVRRTWGNGTLAADDYAGRGSVKRGILQEVFVKGGAFWGPTRMIMQFWWVLLLSGALLDMILRYHSKNLSMAFILHLTMFGFFLFYLIWETNSRYLVVLVPILSLAAADGIWQFCGLKMVNTEKQDGDSL